MMDAEKWKDTILAKSREYVEIGVSVASDLTEKGKTQAKILSNQAKINKAQRQLGALVYSLAKGNEENQPLVDKYIDMIDSIEQENRQLKAKLTPAEATEVENVTAEPEADLADVMADPVQDEAEPRARGRPGRRHGRPRPGRGRACRPRRKHAGRGAGPEVLPPVRRRGRPRRAVLHQVRRTAVKMFPRRFSVSQKRHALGGTHFCAQSRDRNSFPLIFPWGQNLAQNRALAAKRLAHSQR